MNRDKLLLKLVGSLDRNEKITFSKYYDGEKGKRSYNILYRFIGRLLSNQIDKEELVIPRSIAGISNMARAKQSLQDNLLASLRIHYNGCVQETSLDEGILDAILLKKRGLAIQSEGLFKKHKKTAERYAFHYHHCRIIDHLLSLATNGYEKDLMGAIRGLNEEKTRVLEYIKIEQHFENCYRKAGLLVRTKSDDRTGAADQQIDQLCNDLLFGALKPATFLSEIYKLRALIVCYHMKQEREEMFSYFQQLLDKWEAPENKHFKEAYSLIYRIDLYNYLSLSSSLNCDLLYQQLYEKATALKSDFLDEKVEHFQNVEFAVLRRLLKDEEFDEAKRHIARIEPLMDDYYGRIEKIVEARAMSWKYNIAIAFFLSDDFNEAESWFLKIRYEPKSKDQKRELIYASMILLLIVYYEKGQTEKLEKYRESSRKYLERKKVYFDFERMIMSVIHQLDNPNTDKKAIFEKLREDLKAESGKVSGVIEIDHWAESKLLEVSMTELWEIKKDREQNDEEE